jgi:hypothetical protein
LQQSAQYASHTLRADEPREMPARMNFVVLIAL